MTPLSGRYAWPLALLLAVTFVPVALARQRPLVNEVCVQPAALQATSMIEGTRALGEKFDERPEAFLQWSEGEVDNPVSRKHPFRFQILRTTDPREIYERPIKFVDKKLEPERHTVEWREVGGAEIPIHVIRDHTSSPAHVVAYLFVHGNEPVETPLWSVLGDVGSTLWNGHEPLTLFLIDGAALPREDRAEPAAIDWIERAYAYFVQSCRAR